MSAKIVELPSTDIRDVAAGLRRLADGIENGEHGDAHHFVWAIDCGGGEISVGLLGPSGSPTADGHLLFALAMRQLEIIALEK